MSEHTRPNSATRAEEAREAQLPHQPDRDPTPEEEKIAENRQADPEVARHEREMAKRGARQEGEGRLL
jgi:hypothetical protein